MFCFVANTCRLTKQIFDFFDRRPKTNFKLYQDVKEEMHTMNIDADTLTEGSDVCSGSVVGLLHRDAVWVRFPLRSGN